MKNRETQLETRTISWASEQVVHACDVMASRCDVAAPPCMWFETGYARTHERCNHGLGVQHAGYRHPECRHSR